MSEPRVILEKEIGKWIMDYVDAFVGLTRVFKKIHKYVEEKSEEVPHD